MSYADALADLKATFGNKKLLTPSDIAPFVGKSPAAQAKLRERDKFPIKVKPGMGNRIYMSIYDVAHFIGDEVEQIVVTPSISSKPPKQQKTTMKTPAGIGVKKPIRRPPSLGATLRGYHLHIKALALELEFHEALYAELEKSELGRISSKGKKLPRDSL